MPLLRNLINIEYNEECSTGKRGYKTQGVALSALGKIITSNTDFEIKENAARHVYRCPLCNYWHVTKAIHHKSKTVEGKIKHNKKRAGQRKQAKVKEYRDRKDNGPIQEQE